MEDLTAIYRLQGGEDLQWFLGIEIIRDLAAKKIWFAQSDYIVKMETLLDTTNKLEPYKHEDIPIGTKPLLPYEGMADYANVNRYQCKTSTKHRHGSSLHP
jgi:hypothetical protein